MESVSFTQMKYGNREDYMFLQDLENAYIQDTTERIMDSLKRLEKGITGYKISRLRHSIQTASRAWRDGADTDWIISALLHDIGDLHAPHNHGEYASTILKPYVRKQCQWVIATHGEFQMIYYGQHLEKYNQHAREKYREHCFFQDCVDFCERWDQASFDPTYPDLPLAFFRPMLEEVLSRDPYDPAIVNGESSPLVNSGLALERRK